MTVCHQVHSQNCKWPSSLVNFPSIPNLTLMHYTFFIVGHSYLFKILFSNNLENHTSLAILLSYWFSFSVSSAGVSFYLQILVPAFISSHTLSFRVPLQTPVLSYHWYSGRSQCTSPAPPLDSRREDSCLCGISTWCLISIWPSTWGQQNSWFPLRKLLAIFLFWLLAPVFTQWCKQKPRLGPCSSFSVLIPHPIQ